MGNSRGGGRMRGGGGGRKARAEHSQSVSRLVSLAD